MGADQFRHIAPGKTAEEAFRRLVDDALYTHGHGGYSGTIGEKHSFKVVKVPKGMDPLEFVRKVQQFSPNDPRDPALTDEVYTLLKEAFEASDDKWGPAGAVPAGDDRWIFFGWASS